MIIGSDNLNDKNTSDIPDVVLGKSDSDVNKRILINNILNSRNISDVYRYSQGDSNYVINVEFDESTNTFTFSFSDGEVLIAKVNTEGSGESSDYATVEYVNNKVSESLSNLQWKESVPTYSDLSSRYPKPKDGWTVNVDDSDITYRYTGSEWIAISSNSIPLSSVDKNGLMSSSDKKKLDSLKNYDDSEIKEQIEKSVKYQEFDVNRKTIQLSNYDTISGVTTKGLGVNIAMVSKWDKVDLGSPQVEINLNGSKERPTYNDDSELALISDLNSIGVYSLGTLGSFNDVPDALANKDVCSNAKNVIITFVVSNSTYGDEGGFCTNIYTQNNVYQTLYWKNRIQERVLKLVDGEIQKSEFKNKVEFTSVLPNKSVKGPKLFSLTTDSSEDEIKSALTSTISNSLITSSDLDECLNKGLVVKEEVMSGSVVIGWNGSSYTFTEVGLTNPKSEPALKCISISISPDGVYSVTKNGISSKILTESNSLSKFDSKVDKENGKSLISESDAALIPSLLSRISQLEEKVSSLGRSNIESSTISDTPSDSYSDNSKDYVINGSVNTGTLTVNSKSVLLDNLSVSNGARVKLTSTNDIEMKSSSISGDFPKSGGNTIVSASGSDYVTIKGCNIDAKSYNVIEIGLKEDKLPKNVLIDGCEFSGEFSNNAILIFGTSDNAVININNCHFHKVSNILRISNRSNTKCTINITNCSCDEWESNLEYTGMILCQDYTSDSLSSSNNLFSPDKIKINIGNFTLPDGSKLSMPEDLSTICGSGTSSQIIYVYNELEGVVKYNDGSRYPDINIS